MHRNEKIFCKHSVTNLICTSEKRIYEAIHQRRITGVDSKSHCGRQAVPGNGNAQCTGSGTLPVPPYTGDLIGCKKYLLGHSFKGHDASVIL